jgi:hypothetical protein
MSFIEPSLILAVICGLLASLLPLILWRRARSEFPLELFSVPILALASWLTGEYWGLGPEKVGVTFLGAIGVAVAADLEVGILFELRHHIVQRRLLWGLGIVAISVATGLGLRIFLPALPE